MIHKCEVNAKELIGDYPAEVQSFLLSIRETILRVAENIEVKELLETKRWGELSFIAKGGSTIRINWNEATPDRCYMFFICTTKLVSTFQMIYGDELELIGNRAVVLPLSSPVPEEMLETCISMALNYQKLRNKPLLGYSR